MLEYQQAYPALSIYVEIMACSTQPCCSDTVVHLPVPFLGPQPTQLLALLPAPTQNAGNLQDFKDGRLTVVLELLSLKTSTANLFTRTLWKAKEVRQHCHR